MKKLENLFKELLEENPNWSTYTALACAINGMGYEKRLIVRAFNKLVEKDDYAPNEKKYLLESLHYLNESKIG